LGGRLRIPGHDAYGLGIGPQIDIRGGRIGHRVLAGVVAGHRLHEEGLWDSEPVLLHAVHEALGRQDLAARDAGHVGDQNFDLFNLVVF
jgi:hypothetical protein